MAAPAHLAARGAGSIMPPSRPLLLPAGTDMPETPPQRARSAPADGPLLLAALCLTVLVVVYRPVVGGVGVERASLVLFGLALLLAALTWAAHGCLRGALAVRLPPAAALFTAFLAAALASSLRAEYSFAGLEFCCLTATYGLTAFLVLQFAGSPGRRRFFVACLAATGVALAGYAAWHYALYMPALRLWLRMEPGLVQAATGAGDLLARDLHDRIMAERAYGSFLTANQLAAFLVLAFFPLADWLAAWRRARVDPREPSRSRLAGALLAGGATLTLATLYLTRSKGGWLAFLFALALYVAPGVWRLARKRPYRAVGLALAALALLAAAGAWTGALPAPRRFARSLGVRLDYWRTSVAIARERPVLGVGPGAWDEWYAMLKRPEFEETRAPHSAYLRLWAETGTVGLALYVALWASVLAGALRTRAAPPPTRAGPADGGPHGRRLAAGLAVAALALGLDYALVGTLYPPRFVPAWLRAAPWLPYMVFYGLWAATFAAAMGAMGRPSAWALAAGLAGFLLHSAAEVALTVPAVAGTAAVVAGLLLAEDWSPRARGVPLGSGGRVAATLALAAVALLWASVVTPRVLRAAGERRQAHLLRTEVADRLARATGRERPALRRVAREVTDGLRSVCRAVPWDAEAWRELGQWQLRLAAPQDAGGELLRGALAALQKAVELNPLDAAAHALLGRALSAAGRPGEAAAAYRRAAELGPSLPRAWFSYARAAQAAGAAPQTVRAAYRRALELMPRQYHQRNRVPGTPEEMAAIWGEATGEPLCGSLLELGIEMGRRWGGLEVDPAASQRQKLARLADGLPGAAELVERWDSLSPPQRNQALWQVAAGRLWQWALRGTLASEG